MLNLELNTKNGVPFYRQIIQRVEYMMSAEKLKPGDKLPTVRQLAVKLKINPNTVAKAYNELELRGLVNTQVGSGTFISEKKIDISELEKEKKMQEICSRFLFEAKQMGMEKKNLLNYLKKFIEES